jgi:hypothetical protein
MMSLLMENSVAKIGCGDPGDPIDFAALFDGDGNGEAQLTPPATATNKFVISVYVKRVKLDEQTFICSAATSTTNRFWFYITIAGQLRAFDQTASGVLPFDFTTAAIFRDGAKPYHIIMDYNEGDVTFIVGGIVVAEFSVAVAASAGHVPRWNMAIPHRISSTSSTSGGVNFSHGYLSDFKCIAGKSIAAGDLSLHDFGRFNAYGQWVHKTFPGIGGGAAVYGAAGFHQDYADPIDLGKDVSGNGNHFTVAGDVEQVTDTPTNTALIANPLDQFSGIMSEGNTVVSPNIYDGAGTTFIIPDSGDWYFEAELVADNGSGVNGRAAVGLVKSGYDLDRSGSGNFQDSGAYALSSKGGEFWFNGVVDTSPDNFDVGATVALHWNSETRYLEFGHDEADPGVTLTWFGGVTVPESEGPMMLAAGTTSVSGITWRLRLRDDNQKFLPPDGAKALSSDNFPCPDILDPRDYVVENIALAGDGFSDCQFSLLSNKCAVLSRRYDQSSHWRLTTTLRGPGKFLSTSEPGVGEITGEEGLDAFTHTGFTISATAADEWLGSRYDLVIRASPLAGIDIFEFTHVNGTPSVVDQDTGGVIEELWLFPISGGNVRIFKAAMGDDKYLVMNNTNTAATDTGWISRTANQVTFNGSLADGEYVAIAFRSVDQFSKFDSGTGTGSATAGLFCPRDHSPLVCITTRENGSTKWLHSKALNTGNPSVNHLSLGSNAVLGTSSTEKDILSNGVRMMSANNDNAAGNKILVSTLAYQPGKFATAR